MNKLKHHKQNIESLRTCSIEDATNCYEISDLIMDNFNNFRHKTTIDNLATLHAVIKNNLENSNCFAYKIQLNYGSRTFNHAFVILQCSDYFTLCDAWSGIHYLNCREFTNWSNFNKWLNILNRATNVRELYQLFKPDKGDFETDYETLVLLGEYTEKWSDLLKRDQIITDPNPKVNIQMIELGEIE